MRGRRLLDLAAAVVVIAVAVPTRADAAEPDPSAPSVCAPQCPAGQICVGQTCLAPDLRLLGGRPGTAEPPHPDRPAAPAGSAPTTGPQPDPPPDPGPPPPGAPPAPAYAPPPGYPAAPPPGYGYAAPPGYAYPPAPSVYAPDLQRLRKKRAFLLLPHLGLHSFQNRDKGTYDPGGRLGMIIGGRIRDWLSLDADLILDITNTHATATGAAFSQWWFTVAVGPLFQLPLGPIELVAGPKAGYFMSGAEARPTMGPTEHQRASGFALGLNAGVFVPIWANTSVGALLSYEVRNTQQTCRQTTGPEFCTSVTSYDRLFGMSVGALF